MSGKEVRKGRKKRFIQSKQIRRLDFLDQQLVRAQRREKRDEGQGAERGGLMIQGDGESM